VHAAESWSCLSDYEWPLLLRFGLVHAGAANHRKPPFMFNARRGGPSEEWATQLPYDKCVALAQFAKPGGATYRPTGSQSTLLLLGRRVRVCRSDEHIPIPRFAQLLGCVLGIGLHIQL